MPDDRVLPSAASERQRREYRSPELTVYGSVTKLTQGGVGSGTEGVSGMGGMGRGGGPNVGA